MTKWLMLAVAIVSEVVASLALKAALNEPLWYLLVAVGYIAAFGGLTVAMRRGMSLGVAYGIWGAMGVALTAVGATVLFGEPLTPVMVVGLSLIVLGVLIVELGAQQAQRLRRAKATEA